jgi:hypothetical protein
MLMPNQKHRNRTEFKTTVRDDNAIAAPATMGFNIQPSNG